MKYFIGIIILVIGIFMMTYLAFKTRYIRKKLSNKRKRDLLL